MAELTYLQAISDGLRTEMRRDKRVFLIGEDVGVYGGARKITIGFQEEFGPWRVIDAPLAETAIVGGCTGAAIMGLRPVAEMQFADFISCGWDQLVTVAAKQRWRAGTPVPMVVRLPSGGGFSGGPFHSQNPESSFAHVPGLKCVCPATPADAKGLLISSKPTVSRSRSSICDRCCPGTERPCSPACARPRRCSSCTRTRTRAASAP